LILIIESGVYDYTPPEPQLKTLSIQIISYIKTKTPPNLIAGEKIAMKKNELDLTQSKNSNIINFWYYLFKSLY